MPVFRPSKYQINHILSAGYYLFVKTFYIDSFLNILSYVKVDRLWVQEVHDLFIIDFKVATPY